MKPTILKAIEQDVDKSFWGQSLIWGYHKSEFKNLGTKYHLVFRAPDMEYPVLVKKTGYVPNYRL